MRDKLEKIVKAYAELEQKLADPAVVSDPKEYARVAKEHSNQADLVAHANKYITALDDIEAAKELLNATSDPEEKEMLQEDIAANEEMLPQLEDEIKVLAAMRRQSLQATSSKCMSALLRLVVGRQRFCPALLLRQAASRPLSSRSQAIRSIQL